MADFCLQCSLDDLGEDFGDLARLCEQFQTAHAICEGCGPTIVNSMGLCVADCLLHHSRPKEPQK
jgi:hypothetical protein